MRRRDDLPAGSRLLVRGIAKNPHAGERRGMSMPKLSPGQDWSPAKSREEQRGL